MIRLKRIGEGHVCINEMYIESLEETPDSTIKLHNGTTYVVQEKVDAILKLILAWEKKKYAKR